MSKDRIIIPFRDRGGDPHRKANLDVVMGWWYTHGFEPVLIDDGLEGSVPFNRHRAFNRAVERFPETEVFVFSNADLLIHPSAIRESMDYAEQGRHIVVPFITRLNFSSESSEYLRNEYRDSGADQLVEWWDLPETDHRSVFWMTPETVLEGGEDLGSAYVVHADTLRSLGGFPETLSGGVHEHDIISEGTYFLRKKPISILLSRAVHLHHHPAWPDKHQTEEDRRVTSANRDALIRLRADIRMGDLAGVQRLFATRVTD